MVLDLIRMINSPRLYWVYPRGANAPAMGHAYVPNAAEAWGQSVITWLKFVVNLGIYASPLYFPWALRRLEAYRQNPRSLADLIFLVSCVYTAGLVLRACGRRANPVYSDFSRRMTEASKQPATAAARSTVVGYDFDFSAWPVDYNATGKKDKKWLAQPEYSIVEQVTKLPQRLGGWIMINTFGFKMIYPGSVAALQYFIGPSVSEGRAGLIKKGGQRNKVGTEDGNNIDTMYFDNRGKSDKGDQLVIVCEGNAGFYEMGMLNVPLGEGYSVVGWNHPGFWGSTGSPFPSQDTHAADAVMQFAQNKLGYKEANIIIYGWSIGGFTATWLAMNYPRIQGLILDATFDHITPLAVEKMPAFLESTVKLAIADNFNLAVGQQLSLFKGPVRLIRRTKDEMISTDEANMTGSNRGNWLLLNFLQDRFPDLFREGQTETDLMTYLSYDLAGQESMLRDRSIEFGAMDQKIANYVEKFGQEFPIRIGKELTIEERANMALFLASRYMNELDSTHCTPLPGNLFRMPWKPNEIMKQ